MSFADPIKDAARAIGVSKATHPDLYRAFAQFVGTDLVRTAHPSWWVDRMSERLDAVADLDLVVIDDVRFPNEMQMISHRGGTRCFLHAADRLGVNPRKPHGVYKHASERLAIDLTLAIRRGGYYADLPVDIVADACSTIEDKPRIVQTIATGIVSRVMDKERTAG